MNIGAFAFILSMKRGKKYIEEIDELIWMLKKSSTYEFLPFNNFIFIGRHTPLAGFFAKFYIFMSVIESGMYILAIIGLVTTVISAFYYIRIIKIMYFDETKKPFENFKDIGNYGSIIIKLHLLLISFFYIHQF